MGNLNQHSRTGVLCVGTDKKLLTTRGLILAQAGYRTSLLLDASITDRTDLSAHEVILFCHSVSLQRAEAISYLARWQRPSVLTIRLTQVDFGSVPGFDTACAVSSGPARLLELLNQLSSKAQAAA